jgi:hypothetical protein
MSEMTENQPVYLALSGSGLVQLGRDLDSLIGRLCEEGLEGGEDTAVWLQDETGGLRLIAAVRREPAGGPRVTWL